MRVLWLFTLFAVCFGDSQWDRLVSTVPYGGARISVWQFADAPETYYTMPLARLLHDSAKVVKNVLTGKIELNFNILMWSLEATETIHGYLKENVNSSVAAHQVEPLPLERVRLVWKDRVRAMDGGYQLVDNWRAHTDLSSLVTFRINCRDMDKCNLLKTAMKNTPETFYALEMQYLMNPLTRREVEVTIQHLKRTNVYSKIAGMSAAGLVYLTPDTVDALASQTVSVALSTLFSDSVDTGDELSLTNDLKIILKMKPVTASELLPSSWELVFWEPDFSRPDKVSLYLNAVLKIDPNNTQNFIVDESKVSGNREYKDCASDLGILRQNLNQTQTAQNTSVFKIPKESVLNAIRDRHGVRWDGTRFHVRPMTLYLVNLFALNGTKSLVRSKIPVRRYGSVQSLKVRAQKENFTSQLTAELLQLRLQTELTNKLTALKTEMGARVTSLEGVLTKANTTVTHMTSISSIFDEWPEYCRLTSYYCDSSSYASHRSARTMAECRRKCDDDTRCRSFDFRSSSSTRCYLFHYSCPWNKISSSSARDYYVKLARVPLITGQMWKSVWINGTLGGLPSDPCQMIGEYYTYDRV